MYPEGVRGTSFSRNPFLSVQVFSGYEKSIKSPVCSLFGIRKKCVVSCLLSLTNPFYPPEKIQVVSRLLSLTNPFLSPYKSNSVVSRLQGLQKRYEKSPNPFLPYRKERLFFSYFFGIRKKSPRTKRYEKLLPESFSPRTPKTFNH